MGTETGFWVKGSSSPLEKASQGDLSFLQGKALADANPSALAKCHPAAGHLPVGCLFWRALYPALWNKAQGLIIILLATLQGEYWHLRTYRTPGYQAQANYADSRHGPQQIHL